LGFALVACQQTPIATLTLEAARQARTANGFVESIGINTHLGYDDTAYNNFSDVQAKLRYLVIRHFRDGIVYEDFKHYVIERYRALRNDGFRLTGVVPYQTNSIPELLELIRQQGDVL
jgi:hypothetical protein